MERILVPIDGSPRAPAVLSVAAALARKTGAKLILLRAVAPPAEVPGPAGERPMPADEAPHPSEAQAYLEARASDLGPDVRVETQVVTGKTPWQAICEAADRLEADLIIVGSHGHRGLDRLIGSTAAEIVDHATRSVLVVRNANLMDAVSKPHAGARPPMM